MRVNVADKRTISDGAGLGFVKPDHFGSFGANLNLFIELRTHTDKKNIYSATRQKCCWTAGVKAMLLVLIKERTCSCIIPSP